MPDKKTHILMVTRPICLPWDEASKNFAYEIASKSAGFCFHLLTYGRLKISEKPNGIDSNIIQHPIYSSPSLRMSFGQKIRLFYFLLRIPKEIKILHFLFTPSGLTSWLIRSLILPLNRLKGIRINTIQTIATLNFKKINQGGAKSHLFANQIITHSDFSKNFLIEKGLTNVSRIYPGIDLEKYKFREKDPQLLAQLNIKFEDKILLYTGEYTRLKAIDNIVSSFSQVVKEEKLSLKLILACRIKSEADKAKKREVEQRINSLGLGGRVIYLDTFSDMPRLYNLADIFLFPVQEMTGKFDIALTVLEAMASRLAIIVSNIQPLSEAFGIPDCALILKENTAGELTQNILEILQNSEIRHKIGNNARTNVEQYFNIKNCILEYEKAYHKIIHEIK